MTDCLDCGRSAPLHIDGCPSATAAEIGAIVRISSRRAYVVAEIEDHELVHETRDSGFYSPPPSIGDTLIRLADGSLSHRPAERSVTRNDEAPICGPERLGDRLNRYAQTLNERCRDG